MKRLFRIFELSKNEQRVVLIVMLALIAVAFVGYERRIHRSPVQQTSAMERKASPSPVETENEEQPFSFPLSRCMKVLDIIAYTSLISGLISAPFFLFSCVPYLATKNRGPASRVASVSFLVFVFSVVVGLFAGWTGISIARYEVIDRLRAAGDNCQIFINGKPAQNSKEILTVLGSFHTSPAHHSQPTHTINIDVSDGSERTMLRLARDSGDPKEYWVFFPKYGITSTSEIGRIKTSAFDSY